MNGQYYFAVGREQLVEASLVALERLSPGIADRYGPRGWELTRRDFGINFDYLAESLRLGTPQLYQAYIEWLEGLFDGLGLPAETLDLTLRSMAAALDLVATPDIVDRAKAVLRVDAELSHSSGFSGTHSVGFEGTLAAPFLARLLEGDRRSADAYVQDLVGRGMAIERVYLEVFQPSQEELGRLWLAGRIGVDKEHFCTAATQTIMSSFYPRLFSGPRSGRKLVAAGAGNELHEMGIRMVTDLFELHGWDTYYLGTNAPPESITASVRRNRATLLLLSTTMIMNLSALERTIELVRAENFGYHLTVIVGGSPFNRAPELWRTVGADGYAPDAGSAVAKAEELVEAIG